MRRLLFVLAGLLFALGNQIAVFYTAVLLAKSPAFDWFPTVGPGSVGDLLLFVLLLLALEAVLAAVLTLIAWRRRRNPAVLLSVLAVSTVMCAFVWLGLGLV